MPPRKRGSSAKKAKGPSPRTRRTSARTAAAAAAAAEESPAPEPEIPIPAPDDDQIPATEELKAPSPEVVEEEKVPAPETAPSDAAAETEEIPAPAERRYPEREESAIGVVVAEEEAAGKVGSEEPDVALESLGGEEVKASAPSEELQEAREVHLEAVGAEETAKTAEEGDEIAAGVNASCDVEMDREPGTEEEITEVTAAGGENTQGEDVDGVGTNEGTEEEITEVTAGGGEDTQGEDADDVGTNEGDGGAGVEEGDGNADGDDNDGADEDERDDNAVADEGDKVEDSDKSESDDEEEEDHAEFMQAPLSDKKKQKDFEIFIGGLDREAVEEDLMKVFGEYGEIQSVRIVKHPTTQKSKGFAFIRFTTIELAKNVLAELKDGIEVKGKRVGLSASQDNDTLYLGNISKTWTKDNVTTALKSYGIEQIDEIYLPEDPKNEGKIKGYAFIEFSTHSDAMAAFQRLRKPDAIFGRDRSAKVAFAPSSMHPSEEILSQVKTVFVEGLPESWDEEKVNEHCKQYGEIEKVQLSRYFTNARRRDFGFIAFTSRESAVACVEGINNAQLGEGEVKVKANIAKPQNKGRLAKQGARGGFKVKRDGESKEAFGSSTKGKAKFKDVGKGKAYAKLKTGRVGKQPSRPQGQVTGGYGGAPFQYHQRRDHSFKGGKRKGGFMEYARSSKKARDDRNFSNVHGRSSGNRNNPHFGESKKNFNKRPASYSNAYPPVHGAPTRSYQGGAYGAFPGSKHHYPDMEPHAGYADSAMKQARGAYIYGQGSTGGYAVQGTSAPAGYAGGSVPPQPSQVPDYSGYTGYEGSYGYPSNTIYPPSNSVAYPPNNVAYPPPHGAYH